MKIPAVPVAALRFPVGILLISCMASAAPAEDAKPSTKKKPDFPPHASVLSDYKKVVSTTDGKSLYTLWQRKKDNQIYAELPRGFSSKKYFIALTVASGDRYAGLQVGDMYVYWRRFDKRLALIAPNLDVRATGDKHASASVKRLFTDRIVLEVPIVTMGPGGGPVIDLDQMLVNKASTFFGYNFRPHPLYARYKIFAIRTAKAFPENVEVAFEVPDTHGVLKALHYSISEVPKNAAYKPRKADERVGYFTTSYSDLAKYDEQDVRVRYINRWHLEKANAKLKISPPKRPIRFYIEHTTPVRYRRWVKQGILAWNKAFETIGISDALVVEYQDATTREHMEKDPEDVRYNFVRWLNNDIGTAIGPSRVNPLTGEILDADIILTDGWIRHFRNRFSEMLPKVAMEGFGPETLAWLARHPQWDPRIRLAPPSQRSHLRSVIAKQATLPFGGHPITSVDPTLIGDDEFDGLIGRHSQVNGLCLAAEGKAFDIAMMRMHLALIGQDDPAADDDENEDDDTDKDKKDEKKPKKKDNEQMLDGMPESFVGPLIVELVAHEVGHTLGLRHNFKASSIHTMADINSEKLKGKTPLAGSVMDYLPVNIDMNSGTEQGDYAMLGIGPYDLWAIEYGYTRANDLKPILARVAEPELAYATDEDTWGPDPLARRFDFSTNPLDYANNQMRLAKHHRGRILEHFVKDGESWSRARHGYELTLSLQARAISMMANWIGGSFVSRDKKGDKNARVPVEAVPPDTQRSALRFVIETAFHDESFGLTRDLLRHMTVDKWLDSGSHFSGGDEPTWPVHERIMGIQSSTLTMLMEPTTLERIYDNELRVAADQDALTLPELLSKVADSIWTELDQKANDRFTARKPMISSLRRNLQREHMERLIDLTMPDAFSNAAGKPIANLSRNELRRIVQRIDKTQAMGADKCDPYTDAHLSQAKEQIEKALDADYIYNSDANGGGLPAFLFYGREQQQQQPKSDDR